ncbi:MAG: lysophospholipid acyltransferase family protein [Planctomycetota bacterium]|jgi:1-acyl-sn-glycerol-3-phosphate acyltransferase
MFKEKLRRCWFYLARSACKLFCVSFFRIRVYGLGNVPEKGPFILASNHQSYLDPLLCGIFLKRHLVFLARDTLFTKRLFKWLLLSVNAIPLKRDEADISAMRTIIKKLENGHGVCLFPEATRSRDGKIASLKPGFGLLCRRGNAALVPVVIDGAFECWPRDKRIFTRGSITICYGKAVTPERLQQMDSKQIADHITSVLRQMQTRIRCDLGKQSFEY